jgi:hypothetical protein
LQSLAPHEGGPDVVWARDRLDWITALRAAIGLDELQWRRGHQYLTVPWATGKP